MKHENKHLNIELNNISVIRIQFIIFLLNGQCEFYWFSMYYFIPLSFLGFLTISWTRSRYPSVNIWIYNLVKPIGLTKARVKHSHFYVKNPSPWDSEEAEEAKRYVVRCAQATRTHFLTVEQMKRHYNWVIMKAFPYRVISPVSTEAGHMIWKFRI
jgi:hypothetical protein